MENKNILISGAGVAGLTMAYWLKKYGFVPTIVEKHSALRTEGYKLDIRGKAVEVLKRMGLHDAIYSARTDIRKAQFVDASGKVVKETHPDLCGVRTEEDLEIVRRDLCEILFQHMGQVDCLFGDSIRSISQSESGVQVEFERNGTRLFDLVVGADGLHSRVRRLAFGDESHFLRELGLYVAFYSIPNFLHLDRIEIEHHAPKRFAIVYCPARGTAKAGFAFSAPRSEEDLSDRTQQQAFLHRVFANAGWEIPRLLTYMKDSSDFYFDCMAQVQMTTWVKGRVALVGDAGYAVSPVAGQGTSVALIGAYVLAGELAKAQGDYFRAFRCYEENLRQFVRENQKLAQMSVALMEGNSSWLKSKLFGIVLRIGKLCPGSWIQFFKNLGLRQTARAANAIALKDYESEEYSKAVVCKNR